MQMILLIIVMIMICGVTSAQINRHIDYDSLKNNPPEYGHPWDRYFFGSFDFETLPGPLTPTSVNFTLEAAKDDVPEKDDKDWIVQVLYPRHAVKLLGDSLFLWPAPHHIGDIYTGILEFMPLISGKFDISLVRKGTKGAVAFRYCLDEGGSVVVALAMYNAGTRRVLRGTPYSTLQHVARILEYRERLEASFAEMVQDPMRIAQVSSSSGGL